jgi:hypothetical protein
MKRSAKRWERVRQSALRRARLLADVDPREADVVAPIESVPADWTQLGHNNTHGPLPRFYVDRVVVCRDCGAEEVWTAIAQKWWYEVAKGCIDSIGVRCRACRRKERERRAEARRVQLEGLARKRLS